MLFCSVFHVDFEHNYEKRQFLASMLLPDAPDEGRFVLSSNLSRSSWVGQLENVWAAKTIAVVFSRLSMDVFSFAVECRPCVLVISKTSSQMSCFLVSLCLCFLKQQQMTIAGARKKLLLHTKNKSPSPTHNPRNYSDISIQSCFLVMFFW